MVASASRFSYGDCYDLMNKALADPKGIKVKFESYGDALHFRLRLHTARRIDRKDNLEVYPEGNVMHGKSAYDSLIMRIRTLADGTSWLRMEKVEAVKFHVESLSEAAEPELFEPPPEVPHPAMEIQSIKPRPQVLVKRRV